MVLIHMNESTGTATLEVPIQSEWNSSGTGGVHHVDTARCYVKGTKELRREVYLASTLGIREEDLELLYRAYIYRCDAHNHLASDTRARELYKVREEVVLAAYRKRKDEW